MEVADISMSFVIPLLQHRNGLLVSLHDHAILPGKDGDALKMIRCHHDREWLL